MTIGFVDREDDRKLLLVEPDQKPEQVGFLTSYVNDSTGDRIVDPGWVYLPREYVAALVDALVDWLDDE